MQVILGPNAKDESHLVMITAENSVGEEITHPLCWLSKKSVSESQVSIKSWLMLVQPLHIVSSALCIWRCLPQ